MIDFLSIPFIRNAIVGGILIAVLLSVLSLFVFVKRWSFINIGISHAAFGGLAIGFFLGINPTIVGSIFAVLVGILIGYISKKGQIHEDISIGILLSFSMALGVVVMSFSNNYNSDLFAFLFGNILTISSQDILMIFIFSTFSLIFLFYNLEKLMYCCFDEELAYIGGVKTDFLYYSVITIIAIATVLSIKLVGSILSSAMIILPAAVASQLFWRYKSIIAASIVISVIVVLVGIFLSFEYNLPSGSTIVILYSLLFFIVLLVKRILR
ncbi:metal ABC transporter permease [Sulfurihydrogenibium azorense]|uniref:ABC-3 protein n=1 Tax=Sulfurihydrogenibium azorense (strain DSM 15241 / OCM 825 / Az-Fu1) TaxID=204536 RepID=C1DVD1_SULAA|nr:metal ABC transporter permease [Sulfurihydrogenibium azorense]ACN99811.1 ABC-3 protein [Sulfurihydrogenibium azorense Az-Fu1]MDM7272887.1 metal ABC transporter permease [Sulfurihydrogenibium azorense]